MLNLQCEVFGRVTRMVTRTGGARDGTLPSDDGSDRVHPRAPDGDQPTWCDGAAYRGRGRTKKARRSPRENRGWLDKCRTSFRRGAYSTKAPFVVYCARARHLEGGLAKKIYRRRRDVLAASLNLVTNLCSRSHRLSHLLCDCCTTVHARDPESRA